MISTALKLPLMPPILPNKDSGEFPHGANFAVLGATARGVHYTRNDSVAAPCSLGVQMGWFDEMQQRIAPGDGDKRQFLRESLVVMGQIGADDYDSWFSAGRPAENIEDIIPDVVTYISHFTEEFILENGAKPFLIPNIFPMGCLASYLSRYRSDNPRDYDEHGCLRWLNEVSHKHNQELSDEVTRLRFYHPGEAHLRRLLRRRHGTCQESCQIRYW